MGMRRIVALGACLFAFTALAAVASASASATEPAFYECAKVKGGSFQDKKCTKEAGTVKGEKYELLPGIRKAKTFKGKGGAIRLYAAAINAPIPCTGSKDEGKLSSPTTVKGLVVTFTGCSTMFRPCTSPGAKRGEVRTAPLEGQVGAISEGVPGLLAASGGTIASMACEGLIVTLSGGFIGEITGDVNTMSKSFTLTYSETEGGEPAVTRLEGGETEVLESLFDGSGPFVTALRGEITNKTEELEVRA